MTRAIFGQDNVRLEPPQILKDDSCITAHSIRRLTVEETSKLRQIAREHGFSVSPILYAAAVARIIIQHAVSWPFNNEDVYVDMWPHDSRPALQDEFKHGVLLATNMSHSILQVGKRFSQVLDGGNAYSKEEASAKFTKIVLALAEDANEYFVVPHSAEHRAAVAKASPELIPMLLEDMESGKVP